MGGFGWVIVLIFVVFVGLLSVGCLRVGLWDSSLDFGCFGFSRSVCFADWFVSVV